MDLYQLKIDVATVGATDRDRDSETEQSPRTVTGWRRTQSRAESLADSDSEPTRSQWATSSWPPGRKPSPQAASASHGCHLEPYAIMIVFYDFIVYTMMS